ncbi:hypothetical protein RAC89_18185 [Paenibacillus sp. GD4]|jgi:hypothetical protein|uniref:hypothetical protein n=1 Tax=Paenibacillus sp. GD4 TaxID=3068890 RepID=UPI00279689CC|nr:hypothetical protein [Paenibacillus sp. GD4]MDQ1912322.1 hypothetical protein [Paenibacillus sp. GD4]
MMKRKKIKINFIPTQGDVVEVVTNIIKANVKTVLAKHGACIKIGVEEIIRNHTKV